MMQHTTHEKMQIDMCKFSKTYVKNIIKNNYKIILTNYITKMGIRKRKQRRYEHKHKQCKPKHKIVFYGITLRYPPQNKK